MSTPALPAQERPAVPVEIKVLVAAAFVIAVGFGLITPVLPQFAQSFDVGVTAASVIVSAFAFFRLLFAPAGGSLVARLGERPVYIVGLVIVALSTGASAFAQTYWQLLIFRSLGGIGSTMFTVSAMALLVRLAPPSIRGRVSSMYGSAFLIGGVIGPVIGGALGELGMRVPFVVYGVALLLAAVLVATMLRGTPLRADPLQGALTPMTVREALGDSAYRAALVSAFANGWTNFGVRVAILPLFAVAVVGETWAAAVALGQGHGPVPDRGGQAEQRQARFHHGCVGQRGRPQRGRHRAYLDPLRSLDRGTARRPSLGSARVHEGHPRRRR